MTEPKVEKPDAFDRKVVSSEDAGDGKNEHVHRERHAYIVWDSFERLLAENVDTKADAEAAIERLLSKSIADEHGDGEWRYAVVKVPVRTASIEFVEKSKK